MDVQDLCFQDHLNVQFSTLEDQEHSYDNQLSSDPLFADEESAQHREFLAQQSSLFQQKIEQQGETIARLEQKV